MGSRTLSIYQLQFKYLNHFIFSLNGDLHLFLPDTQGKPRFTGTSTAGKAAQEVLVRVTLISSKKLEHRQKENITKGLEVYHLDAVSSPLGSQGINWTTSVTAF